MLHLHAGDGRRDVVTGSKDSDASSEVTALADAATREIHGDDYRLSTRLAIEAAIRKALSAPVALGEMPEEPREALAIRLIDAWCADNGKKIPWAKAVQIIAIVTKQSDEERDRLLRMGDEDGSCEMCGRSAAITSSASAARAAALEEAAKICAAEARKYSNSGNESAACRGALSYAETAIRSRVSHPAGGDGAPRPAPSPEGEEAKQGWIAVGERLPDEDDNVLCYFGDHCPPAVGIFSGIRETESRHGPAGQIWQDAHGAMDEWDADPTHWMPLPSPPRDGREG